MIEVPQMTQMNTDLDLSLILSATHFSFFILHSSFFMESTKIQAYGKTELALLYYPKSSILAARRLFMRDLKRIKGLMPLLETKGYSPNKKTFTCQQVALIFEYYGSPYPPDD